MFDLTSEARRFRLRFVVAIAQRAQIVQHSPDGASSLWPIPYTLGLPEHAHLGKVIPLVKRYVRSAEGHCVDSYDNFVVFRLS
jgi:hypothetical protein